LLVATFTWRQVADPIGTIDYPVARVLIMHVWPIPVDEGIKMTPDAVRWTPPNELIR
jgi:hypothetical protein